MKFLKIGIRFWITLTSVLSFLTGWVMLAHAPKPNQAGFSSSNVVAPLPTLQPLNSLSLNSLSDFGSDDNNFQNQPLFSVQPSVRSQFRPAFRTGGS
jgi:hypothetical protein